jgi:hypothetical protein
MKLPAPVRSALALSAVVVTVACSGTAAPTSPSAALTSPVSTSSAATDAKGGSLTGTAALNFVDTGGGVLGFAAATQDGQTGRVVQLTGDIEGTNFEPGVCHDGVDMSLGFPTYCVVFGDGPGQFTRYAPGGVAFTTCTCTVGGVGEVGDQVILKISYPPAVNELYPGGFTKFTFQAGTGALARLSGQGTLDFADYPQASFTYRFAGR